MKQYARRSLWSLLITALALVLAGQLVARSVVPTAEDTSHPHVDGDQGTHLDWVWRFRPQTFQAGRARASLIVLADIAAVERGPDLVGIHPEEPTGETRYGTQRITLNVLKVYSGQATLGQPLTLYQSGGRSDTDSRPLFALGSPPYQQGERYVLLLEPAGEEDLFRIIAPEGRYRIGQGGVSPMVDNAVTQELRGKPLQYLEQRLSAP